MAGLARASRGSRHTKALRMPLHVSAALGGSSGSLIKKKTDVSKTGTEYACRAPHNALFYRCLVECKKQLWFRRDGESLLSFAIRAAVAEPAGCETLSVCEYARL